LAAALCGYEKIKCCSVVLLKNCLEKEKGKSKINKLFLPQAENPYKKLF